MTLLTSSFKHLRAHKDKVSASQYNRLVDLVSSMAGSLMTNGFMDSTGFFTRRQPGGGSAVKIFEVQTRAYGTGVYNCFEKNLDATNWTNSGGADKFIDKETAWNSGTTYEIGAVATHEEARYVCKLGHINQEPPNGTYWTVTEIEVLNLYENDPNTTPECAYCGTGVALGLYDRIAAWVWVDDAGYDKYVGIPLTPQIRFVRAAENAPAADCDTTSITCNLILNNDEDAVSGELGYGIEVYGSCVGGTADWNEVAPRIISDEKLTAQCIQGTWAFTTEFMPSEDCDCYEAP